MTPAVSLATMLVVAKAPRPGLVKTRLGRDIGMDRAADLAAAALLDTLHACTEAVGGEGCHLSLDGDLATAERADELQAAVAGWVVTSQRGDAFAERLAHAHGQITGPVVQVGMDTPQLTAALLLDAAAGLETHDAVLGPAEDGGWWALALRDPALADALRPVAMSTAQTCRDTYDALIAAGARVGVTAVLRDVDTVADADAVATLAPDSRFATAWTGVRA